jgi:hypothetical protein
MYLLDYQTLAFVCFACFVVHLLFLGLTLSPSALCALPSTPRSLCAPPEAQGRFAEAQQRATYRPHA